METLEVVFSDSVKGAMRIAKIYGTQDMQACSIGYIGEKPDMAALRRQFEGRALGGSRQNVVCISFALDIGDLSGDSGRMAVLHKLWGQLKEEEAARFIQDRRQDLQKLLDWAKAGRPVRLWTSEAPYAACGFLYVCDILRDIDCTLTVLRLPGAFQTEEAVLACQDWGEVPPGQFYQFLPLEREVLDKKAKSDEWRELAAENAPLRAVVNGKLISVPEDFYDHLLYKNIPDGEFGMGQLIGNLLGKYHIGISDSWYALRIHKLIREQRLKIVSQRDVSHPYSLVLKQTE